MGLLAGETVLAAKPARAANGDPLTLGTLNYVSSSTGLEIDATPAIDAAFYMRGYGYNRSIYVDHGGTGPGVDVFAGGIAVNAVSIGGTGLYAVTEGSVHGEGVYAQSGPTAGTSPGATHNGVHGVTDSPSDSGVWGEAVGGGYGVAGSTSSSALNGPAGVWGSNGGGGPGVKGTSSAGAAVYGQSGAEGMYAQSGGTAGTLAGGTRSGVHGVTNSPSDSGGWGESLGAGHGVSGTTSSTASERTAGFSARTSRPGRASLAIPTAGRPCTA